MKNLLYILFMIIFGGLFSLLAPWWIIAFIAFFVAMLAKLSPLRGFMAGFVAMSVLWAALAYYLDLQNAGLLSGKVAQLFTLNQPVTLIAITALIGGLVGGFGGMTAAYFRKMLI